jgi:hypothetical protein
MTPARCRDTLPVMGIKSVVRLPRRWLDAAGVALVTGLAVAGAYVEANPVHRYGGLHLASHPPLAAYLLLAVPSVALIWRNSRPVEVLGLAVGGAVGWAALGQIDGAALVPVIVGVYWVALTRARRIAVAAGLAGAAAIFVTEGLLGPFGWFGGPNATMWPRSARTWRRAASGWPLSLTARRGPSRPGRRKPAGASTPSGCGSRASCTTWSRTPWR